MSEPTDIDDLIAEFRSEGNEWSGKYGALFFKAADALESTAAELRQERERADGAVKQQKLLIAEAEDLAERLVRVGSYNAPLVADLSRAREVIARITTAVQVDVRSSVQVAGVREILATYDENGSARV